MPADVLERAPTVTLWRDLWRHCLALRAENRELRAMLGLPRVEHTLELPDLPPPSLRNRCIACGKDLEPRNASGLQLYCSPGCRQRSHAQHG